ncbi:MAG: hypothetical protein EBS92_07210 [Proteobacteria bacterium]|nr:hypothetical protein [Pseudomonadota bacterium]
MGNLALVKSSIDCQVLSLVMSYHLMTTNGYFSISFFAFLFINFLFIICFYLYVANTRTDMIVMNFIKLINKSFPVTIFR